jgi:hypothetical protein
MKKSFGDIGKKASLEYMYKIWQAVQHNQLDDLDKDGKFLAEIMLEHDTEFYNDFEFADLAHERIYDPGSDTNSTKAWDAMDKEYTGLYPG